MIYAIIVISFGILAYALNRGGKQKSLLVIQAILGVLAVIYGVVGTVIMNTARFFVFEQNPVYWALLVLGSLISIVLGVSLFYNYLNKKKDDTSAMSKLSYILNILSVLAIIVGGFTLLAMDVK